MTSDFFPAIEAISDIGKRPLWSVMIPTFNSSEYLIQTLESVLCQDPGSELMQIEIIDDCSQGNPALETLKKLKLIDRVQYYRQPGNVGLGRNWNTCILRAKGEIVHILHQDDLVFKGFYQAMQTAYLQEPAAGAVFCRYQLIDSDGNFKSISPEEQAEPGIIPNWLEKIASQQRILTPSITVRRGVYEKLGGFHPSSTYVLDWEMWIRISNSFPFYYVPETLAAYRVHRASETFRLRQSAETFRDIRRSLQIRNLYLSPQIAKKSEKIIKSNCTKDAFADAIDMLNNHQIRGYFFNLLEWIRTGFTLASFISLIMMTLHIILKHLGIYPDRQLNKPNTSKGSNQ